LVLAPAPASASRLVGSFDAGLGQLVALGFDPSSGHTLVYPAFGETIHEFSDRGGSAGTIPRPGAASNDFDIEVLGESISLGGQTVPAGELLIANGDDSPQKVYGVEGDQGGILASIDVGAAGVGVTYHEGNNTLLYLDWGNDLILELNPDTGATVDSFPVSPQDAPFMDVFFGDVAVGPNGNLFIVSDQASWVREMTPSGAWVQDFNLENLGVAGMSGLDFDPATGQAWMSSTNGFVYNVVLEAGSGGGDPVDNCNPNDPSSTCGTTGDDDLESNDGVIEAGPGQDEIVAVIDAGTTSLVVNSGADADVVTLRIDDPTVDVSVVINGDAGNDTILIPSAPGVSRPFLDAGDGNDVIRVQANLGWGRALQDDGGGYDVSAGAGNDAVTGGTTSDDVNAGAGADSVKGSGGGDDLNGAGGGDSVDGGAGNDGLSGGGGKDVLHGGGGANELSGGPGRDTCLSDTKKDSFAGCEKIRRNHRRNHFPATPRP
jgi:Ca2+-binding RTX toxin-like protein